MVNMNYNMFNVFRVMLNPKSIKRGFSQTCFPSPQKIPRVSNTDGESVQYRKKLGLRPRPQNLPDPSEMETG